MVIGFLVVLFGSILLTVMTFLSIFNWWMEGGSESIRPANYYENLVPEIEKFARDEGDHLLENKELERLETLIPSDGLTYKIVDEHAKFIAGTFTDHLPNKPLTDLINLKINNKNKANNITYYIPLTDNEDRLKGALVLNYDIAVSATSFVDFLPIVLLFLSPFVYFTSLTLLMTHIIGKSVAKPINDLVVASHRIKDKDLDFKLEYKAKNEVGELVTAFESMRAALEESLIREWRLEEERREYVNAISHDLKTPLTIIRGHAEGLEDVWQNEKVLFSYLTTINLNVDRVINLINEFNMINEIDSYSFTLFFNQCEIASWINNKIQDYTYLVNEKEILFTYQIENEDDLVFFTLDEGRMNRVVDNLMTNSIRFTDTGGKIHIKAFISSYTFEFHVYDSGVGFQTKNTDKLFTRFYQGDLARTKSGIHSGQGLFIAKTIVEKHGGQIFAENRGMERGAHVWFLVPNKQLSATVINQKVN